VAFAAEDAADLALIDPEHSAQFFLGMLAVRVEFFDMINLIRRDHRNVIRGS
jgi:hypothetical protein